QIIKLESMTDARQYLEGVYALIARSVGVALCVVTIYVVDAPIALAQTFHSSAQCFEHLRGREREDIQLISRCEAYSRQCNGLAPDYRRKDACIAQYVRPCHAEHEQFWDANRQLERGCLQMQQAENHANA